MKTKIRLVGILMAIMMVLSIFAFLPALETRASAATTKTVDQAVAWLESKVGQALDFDGAYGAQCVDLIYYYYQYLGASPVGGDAANYAWNTLPSGWTRIAGATPQAGDIMVWTGNTYGHVAICGGSSAYYHQNFNYAQYVTKQTKSYMTGLTGLTYYGVIRPDFGSTSSVNVPSVVDYPVKDGVYIIKNVQTGKVINSLSPFDTNGSRVVLWDYDGSTEQTWRASHEGNGVYWFYAMRSNNGNGKVMDLNMSGGGTSALDAGDTLDIYAKGGWDQCQQFNIVPIGNNKFVIELKALDNYVLGITANSNNSDITLQRYTGSASQQWYFCDLSANVIDPSPQTALSDCTISSISAQTYTGSEIKPTVTVKDGTKTLVSGTDYTVSYTNNVNVGTATVAIAGKGNYSGTVNKTFTINAKSVSSLTVSSISAQTYTGSAIKPAVTVKNGSTTLVSGTDYTVAYSNNTNVGTATVTITGKGNYSGTKTISFNIISSTKPRFIVSSATASAGQTINVDISMANNPGITALLLDINYDTTRLSLQKVTFNSAMGGSSNSSPSLASPATVSWYNGLANMTAANVKICTLEFKVLSAAPDGKAQIGITYDIENIFNVDFESIEFETTDGGITVTDKISGDVNADGAVNMRDVVALFQYVSKWNVTINEVNADVNAEGSVNMRDVVLLFQYVSRWDVVLQ